jgi:hypothetical protein
VGAVFVVSFIMITVGQSIGDYNTTLFDNLSEKAGIPNKILEPEALFAGAGSLQSFMWLLMSVAIMWLGVFAVLQDMPIVGTITQTIKGYGDSLAKLVATLPYKAPILPLGEGGEKKSLKEVLGPLDLRGKIAEYTGENITTPADVRKFNSTAGGQNVAQHLQRLTTATGKQKVTVAENIAKAYGFRNLEHMMEMNADALRGGFRSSKQHQGNMADDLYTALKRAQTESSTEKSRRLTDTERATQSAVERASAKQQPPGTAPAPNPPAAAPPGAKPASSPGTSAKGQSPGTK